MTTQCIVGEASGCALCILRGKAQGFSLEVAKCTVGEDNY